MATSEQYIQLAKALPAQLQRFLARYPPASILGAAAATTTSSASSTDALSTPKADTTTASTISPTAGQPAAAVTSRGNRPVVPGLAAAEQHPQPATPHTSYQAERPDPFSWLRHPVTGRWISPVYSARRQAQLFQLARAHGVEELLPPSNKSPAARLERRVALGLRVKGTGVGQRVKGHAYEREMEAKMNERRRAMLEMPRLIKNWKRLGRDGWKKWPK